MHGDGMQGRCPRGVTFAFESGRDGELQIVRRQACSAADGGVHSGHGAERFREVEHNRCDPLRSRAEELQGGPRREAHGPHLRRGQVQGEGVFHEGVSGVRQHRPSDALGRRYRQAHTLREALRQRDGLQLVLLRQRPQIHHDRVRRPPHQGQDQRRRVQPRPAG